MPIADTATVNATNQSFGANSATANDVVATAAQADLALSTAGSAGDGDRRERHHVHADDDEQRSGGGNGGEFHRGDTDEHDVPIGAGAGRMDLHDPGSRRHRKCDLHRSQLRCRRHGRTLWSW